MRKALTIGLVVALVAVFAGMAMAQPFSQTFTFTTEVEKYIEVGGDQTLAIPNPVIPGGGVAVPIAPPAAHILYGGGNEIAYANCPFKVLLEGGNDVDDHLPILARLEVGGVYIHTPPPTPRYDRLITSIGWQPMYDSGWDGAISFVSDPDGAATGTWTHNPLSLPVPHDGEVGVILYLGAALPHNTPEFGVDNTWNESADAGEYKCYVKATYTAL